MDVSVLIINYNTKDLTANCIKSIYASDTKYSFEIILVDNASSDSSVDSIEKIFPKVRLIENKQNVGFARANNQAANVAAGRYLYILNSDTEIEKDVIDKVISYGDSNKKAGIIGTMVIFPDGHLQKNFYKFPSFFSELIFFTLGIIKSNDWFLFNLNKYKGNQITEPFEVDVIAGCSMFVRRQVYEELGLFDEKFFMYYEDSEFCHRVKNSGYQCIYFPMSVVEHMHKGSASKNDDNFKLLLSCFKGACLYFTKVRSSAYSALFIRLCRIVWFIEIVILEVILIFRKNNKITRKINMLRSLLNG